MLTTLQITDSTVIGSLRRKLPKPAKVDGLLGSLKALCGPFNHKTAPDLQPSRSMIIGWWESEGAFDAYHAANPTPGFLAKLELVRNLGSFPGLDRSHEELRAIIPKRDEAMPGPTVAITIGKPYLSKARAFMKASHAIEVQSIDAPGMLWGTGFSPLPFGVASLTIWDSTESTMNFMRSAAHGDGIDKYYDAKKDIGGHTFVHSGGFFGFKPLSWSGELPGRNPLPVLPPPVATV